MKRPATAETLLYTIPEAAAQLRRSRGTVYNLISDGLLEAIDIARPGSKETQLRITRDALVAYIAACPRINTEVSA